MAKKLILSLLLFFLLLGPRVWAQPQITFDALEIDKGLFPQGMNCVFKFGFTNTGDSTLVIQQVKSSCGCLVPRWGMEPIPPGGRGVVEGRYDSNHVGIFQKSLTVMTNDPRNPVIALRLKGEVFEIPRLDYFPGNDSTSLSFFRPEDHGDPCRGSADNRPCLPAPDGPRYLVVRNPSAYSAASLDLCAYNDALGGHHGIFFCHSDAHFATEGQADWATSAFNPVYVAANWNTKFTDNYHLPPNGTVYMVILDVAWLRETVFANAVAEWAVPVGASVDRSSGVPIAPTPPRVR